jgi:rhamnose utilization protein RhaD (predicted bifunctional aldolase and dehydrogenase)
MRPQPVLSQLVSMSRNLGDPALDYAVLGEGNSSARVDGDTFWVKASGAELRTIGPDGFVKVRYEGVLRLLDSDGLDDDEVKAALEEARVDPTSSARPSVETVLHALALQLPEVNFVGHTHPTAINALLCSRDVEQAIAGRLFPDEIIYCGVAPVFVPYTDPGVPLARTVRDLMQRYMDAYGEVPKVVLMQNHGLIALGSSSGQVENITAMAVKAARVLLGTFALGGPRFMTADAVARIHTRPDEQYRRLEWGGDSPDHDRGSRAREPE